MSKKNIETITIDRNTNVNEVNTLLYAAQCYTNYECIDDDEFMEDFSRFKWVKRLVNKYIEGKELNARLIMNHIVILNNVFGIKPTLKIFYIKTNDRTFSIITSFYKKLDNIPIILEDVGLNKKNINMNEIKLDNTVLNLIDKQIFSINNNA